MKILLITDNHTKAGGAEHYFFDLKQRLKTLPEADVYSIGFGDKEEEGNDYFVLKSLKSNFAKMMWRLFLNPFIYFKLRNKIKKFNPDIIHLHNTKQYTSTVLRAIRTYPIVQTIHDYGVICPVSHNIHKNHQACPTGFRAACFWQHQVKYNRLVYLFMVYALYKLRKQLRKNVDIFFAPSPLLVKYLQQNQFQQATYIPPFKSEKKIYSFDKVNPNHFLFAGNLGTHKGVYLLIEEFALAVKQNKNLTLTISGSGPERTKLEKKVKTLAIEQHVSFVGWQEDMDSYYEQCAAVIFPSIWIEAFGLVITDAMSHARPVIGSNRGSPPWLIDHQKTGLIFEPARKGDLANKILCLAGNKGLIELLGKNGFNKLKNFIDNETTLKKIVETYKAITKKGAN